MNPLAIGLIVLGGFLQIAAVLLFVVLADAVQLLPLIATLSIGSAIELAGVLVLVRSRQ